MTRFIYNLTLLLIYLKATGYIDVSIFVLLVPFSFILPVVIFSNIVKDITEKIKEAELEKVKKFPYHNSHR